jgi:hypothetical protein
MFMLSFTGCNDNHIAPRDSHQCRYAKVGHGEYAKSSAYGAKGEYREYTKEDISIKEGHNKPLAKNGDWAGCNNEPLASRSMGHVRHKRQQIAPYHKEQLGHNPSSSQ